MAMSKNVLASVFGAVAFAVVAAMILSFATSIIYASHLAELRKEEERRRTADEIEMANEKHRQIDRELDKSSKNLLESIAAFEKAMNNEVNRVKENSNK